MGGGNIQQHNFIHARSAMRRCEFSGVAGIAEVEELYSLHHASSGDIETSDDTFSQHQFSVAFLCVTLCPLWFKLLIFLASKSES